MITDPINDMFTRIRNALKANHEVVVVPFSIIKEKIANILKNEGFIHEYKIGADERNFKQLQIKLKYKQDGSPEISLIKKISKSGGQHYVTKSQIPKVLNGFGICILSTSKGIATGRQARLNNVGGELIGIIH